MNFILDFVIKCVLKNFRINTCIRVLFLNTMQSYARFLHPKQKKFQMLILRHERSDQLRQRLKPFTPILRNSHLDIIPRNGLSLQDGYRCRHLEPALGQSNRDCGLLCVPDLDGLARRGCDPVDQPQVGRER